MITALKHYPNRDFEAELQTWHQRIQTLVLGLGDLPGLSARYLFPLSSGRPVPTAQVHVDPAKAGLSAYDLINALQKEEPIVCTYETSAAHGIVIFFPESLRDGEPEETVQRVRSILSKRR